MKKKKREILIFAWLIILSLAWMQNNTRLEWLEAQYDNVIEILITDEK